MAVPCTSQEIARNSGAQSTRAEDDHAVTTRVSFVEHLSPAAMIERLRSISSTRLTARRMPRATACRMRLAMGAREDWFDFHRRDLRRRVAIEVASYTSAWHTRHVAW